MSYTSEEIKKAGEVFFHLFDKKILPASDVLAAEYYDNNAISEIVKNFAEEGGLSIITTRQNLHLVARGEDSIFATTYTKMKEEFKLDRKKHFYLANMIICIYLAEIDRENNFSFRIEDAAISYYKLEEVITETLDSWIKRNQQEEAFAQDFAIAIEEIHHLWSVEMSHSKEAKEGVGFSLSKGTRLGFIHEALRPLEKENLIICLSQENRIIPKEELYERLQKLYHGGDRYEEIMELIKNNGGEQENAETNKN